MRKRAEYIVGIDEVGRGSLAGPLFVAAVALRRGSRLKKRDLGELKDSKRLTALRRERWHEYFDEHPSLFYASSQVSVSTIDRMNVARAANLAALRACKKLERQLSSHGKLAKVYLDGGLFLGNGGPAPFPSRTVVKGDEKFAPIKAASIIAKVRRDRLMRRLSVRYPEYGLDVHKGYGTRAHRKAIEKHGPASVHRLTFIGDFSNI